MGVPSAPDLWRRPMRGAVPNPQSAGGWPLSANGRQSAAAPCNTFWRQRTGLCRCLFRADPSKSPSRVPRDARPFKTAGRQTPGPVLRVVCPGPCHGPDARGHTLGQGGPRGGSPGGARGPRGAPALRGDVRAAGCTPTRLVGAPPGGRRCGGPHASRRPPSPSTPHLR